MSNTIPTDQRFIQVFHLLISSARIHQNNNKTLIYSVNQFIKIVHLLCHEENEVTLLFTEGGFYLQEEKINFELHAASFAHSMLKFFEERNLSGLRFHDSIQTAPVPEVATFARLLIDVDKHDDGQAWFERKLEEQRLTWVEHLQVSQVSLNKEQENKQPGSGQVSPATTSPHSGRKAPEKGKQAGQRDGQTDSGSGGDLSGPAKTAHELRNKKRKNAIQTYGYAVLSLQDVAQKISSNKRASIKKTMRMVQSMIDMVVDDNNMFLSLSTIRDYDDYTFTHSINVAILSICLGHKIKLSKPLLETLSLSALFHDLGKIDVPRSILNKPGRLTNQELNVMKRHALDSVRRIIKLKTTRKRKSNLLLPPFEHHLKYDLSGYPKTPRKRPISLFGRIIAIADVYDAITAPRVYRPVAWSPDRALGLMLDESGTSFDPILLKVFINMIGVYPVGTLLKLDQDEMGLVAKYSGEAEQGKELWVQLLAPVSDREFEKGELINLGSLDIKSGTFKRPIVESYHPSTFGIQPAEYIM